MSNLEDFSNSPEANPTRIPDVFIHGSEALSAITLMDAQRQNGAAEEVLGSLVLTSSDGTASDSTKQADGQKETTEPVQVCQTTDRLDPTFEQAEKLKQQTFQDCRDGKYGDALKHRKEAFDKYYEYYNAHPPTSPESTKQQQETYYQLNFVTTIALNKIKVAPNWEPPKGPNLPSTENARPKPKIDQDPWNKMIER